MPKMCGIRPNWLPWGMLFLGIASWAAPKPVLTPTPDQALEATRMWSRWEDLVGQWFFALAFVSPDPVSALMAPPLTDRLVPKRGGPETTGTVQEFLKGLTPTCGAEAMAQSVVLSFAHREDRVVGDINATQMKPVYWVMTLTLSKGLANITEDEWAFLLKRGNTRLPDLTVEVLTPTRMSQLDAVNALTPELEEATRFLAAVPIRMDRMRTELGQAWVAYEGFFAHCVRETQSVQELRGRLKDEFAKRPPEWPRLEARILNEGLPTESQFAFWKTAVLKRLTTRLASFGRTAPPRIPEAFAIATLERLGGDRKPKPLDKRILLVPTE